MDFLRQHLFLIGCASAVLISLVFGAGGLSRMSGVTTRMTASQNLLNQLQQARGSRGGAINAEAIAAADQAVNECKAHYEQIRDYAAKVNAREPLLPDIFPRPQKPVLRYNFRTAYKKAVDELPAKLKGGPKPGRIDIENWQMALQQQGKGSPTAPGSAPGIDEAILKDPAARAAIDQAQKIRCYVEPDSLDIRDLYRTTGEPTLAEMWSAQVSLWIQQDIVDTVARLNEEAAAKLGPGVTPCVLHLPVKRIVGIAISDYASRAEGGPGPRAAQAVSRGAVTAPPADPRGVFTRRQPGSLYDVLYFTVRVIVDAREALRFIAALSEKNLYTPVDVDMRAVEPPVDFHDYLYGPNPVVELEVVFEACQLADVYSKLMPQAVVSEIEGRTRAQPGR